MLIPCSSSLSDITITSFVSSSHSSVMVFRSNLLGRGAFCWSSICIITCYEWYSWNQVPTWGNTSALKYVSRSVRYDRACQGNYSTEKCGARFMTWSSVVLDGKQGKWPQQKLQRFENQPLLRSRNDGSTERCSGPTHQRCVVSFHHWCLVNLFVWAKCSVFTSKHPK